MNYEAAKNYIAIRKGYDVIYKNLNDIFGDYAPIICLIEDLDDSLWNLIELEEEQYMDLATFIEEKEFDKADGYVTKIYKKELADASSVAATEWVPAITYTYRIYELFHKNGTYQAEVVYESTDEDDAWDYFESCCNSNHSYLERYYIDELGETHYQEWNSLTGWINIEVDDYRF